MSRLTQFKQWIYRVRYQLMTVLFIWITLFNVIREEKKWTYRDCIESDVAGYYGYLPAQFIRHDIKLNYFHDSLMVHRWQFWPQFTPEGHKYIKYTMGMAYLYSPMFAAATVYAKIKGYPVDGYSRPYQRNLQFSAWFYLLFGLWFLWKYLKFFFTGTAIALTMLLVVFGTNLFYYVTGEAGFPHAFNFSLYCMLLYSCFTYALRPNLKKLAFITLLLALLTLIRPINVLAVFIFFFPQRIAFSEVKARFAYLWSKKISFLVIFLVAGLVFLPQFIYWKYVTGHWIIYSYGNESFDFAHPHILDGLFSYKKGWLVYTPLWIFLLPGFYFLYRKNAQLLWSILLLFVVYTYVVFSWWAWYYGGSFGSRAMIDIYPLLAVPLAAFLDRLISARIYYKLALIFPLVFVMYLNLFQTYQYKSGLIHWNGMDKETYWTVWGKKSLTPEEWKYVEARWTENDK